MANLTQERLEAWITARAAGKLGRRVEEDGFDVTLEADRIYVGHEVQGAGRMLRIESYHIPSLAAKILSRVDLSDGLQPGELRDAIKAAVPNPKLAALLDRMVP